MYLYDRTEDGSSTWSKRGCRISTRIEWAIESILSDEMEDEPVCIRDFEGVAQSTISTLCAKAQLKRKFATRKKEEECTKSSED